MGFILTLYIMRITQLTLSTPEPKELKRFYGEQIGFPEIPAISESDGFAFQAGHTRVNIIPGDRDARYHFAFNVYPDQLTHAIQWAQDRGLELLHSPEDKGILVDFPNWWAKSIYFFDPAGNIVEIIARGGVGPIGNTTKFSAKSLIGVSEIGIVTGDVPAMREWIATAHGLQPFSRHENTDTFSAMGDDHGLLLIVNTGRNWFMGNFDAHHFPLAIEGETDGKPFKMMLP